MNRLFDAVRIRDLLRQHARWLCTTIVMVAAGTVAGHCMARLPGGPAVGRVLEMNLPVWQVRVASDQIVAGLLSERGEFTPLYPTTCDVRPPPGYWIEIEKIDALRRLAPDLSRHFGVGHQIYRIDRLEVVRVSAAHSPQDKVATVSRSSES